ncbi:SMP-30/gluconolactonase/LRE family protein [Leptothrix sp. BB-4]
MTALLRTPGQLLVDARNTLGECALWCDRSQSFWWTDIEGRVIHRRDEASGTVQRWPMPDRVGSFAFCDDPDLLLLGLAGGIALHRLSTGATSAEVPVEPQHPTTRINDGRCDREGRFLFGMYNQTADEAPLGAWYRVDAELNIETLPLPIAGVANSLCFSPDGRRMYHTDSPGRTIWCRDYGPDGRIGPAEVFVRLDASEGYPDGSCVDAAGGVWTACWDGHAVRRHDDQGRLTDVIDLPVPNITCPAFGGAALDRLYMTSARKGLDAAGLAACPTSGGVFVAPTRHRGLPEQRFRTGLGA